jgi:hypothetical protein
MTARRAALIGAVFLLPSGWLAQRLLFDRATIAQLCRAATWYDPARCEPEAILTRGIASLLVAILATLAALVLRHRLLDAGRTTTGEPSRAHPGNLLHSLERIEWLALAGLVAIGIAARWPLLELPMRSDENQTLLLYTSRSMTAALWQFDTTNNHLLYSVLARPVVALAGPQPWAARLPEVVAGTLLIPAAVFALPPLYGRAAAWLVAGVLAALPYLVAFSTNGRGYSLVALLTVLAVPASARLSQRPSVMDWAQFASLAGLALFTNPVAVYPLGALGAWILVRRLSSTPRRWLDVLAGAGAIAVLSWLLYAPAFTAMGAEALFANPWMRPPTWEEFTASAPVVLDGTLRELWWQWGWGIAGPLRAAVVALVLLALLRDLQGPPPARALGLVSLGWVTVVAVGSHRVPYTRVLQPFLPLLLAAAAWQLITIVGRLRLHTSARRAAGAALVIALLFLLLAGDAARDVYMTERAATGEWGEISSPDARPRLL